MEDIKKTLKRFGCNKFGQWDDYDTGTMTIQFEWQGRVVELKASASGYAAAWLEEHPWSTRIRCGEKEHKQKAIDKGRIAVYSILRDWVKAQVTAVETGLLTFEGVFMPHMLLPDGTRLLDRIDDVHKLLGCDK
jgi:hypothetical protein